MNNIIIKPPIKNTSSIANLKSNDLTKKHSNVFEYSRNKTSNGYEAAYNEVFKILKQSPSFMEFLNETQKNYKDYEIVFPKGILKKLKSGEYILNKKVGTDEFLTFVKDKKTNNIIKQLRLKEISKTKKFENILPSLQNMALQQSLNQISTHLEVIEQKLIHIHQEFNNNRIGTIQAGYNQFLSALQMNDVENRKKTIISAISLMEEGRSQLIESAKLRMTKLDAGIWKLLLEGLKSLSFKNPHQENQKEFMNELFYIERSSQLILLAYQELNEPDALVQSLAPFRDMMKFLNNDKIIYKLNEYDEKNTDWKTVTTRSIEAIDNIPDFETISNKEIKLEINNI